MAAARGKMVECVCARRKDKFMAREADRKRGWGKFCSKSCKAIKQEEMTGQFAAYLAGNESRADDDDVDISDMDWGASDGGGYESFK